MCGIAGAYNYSDRGTLLKMLQKIKHRGPDEEGVFIHNKCMIGVQRLSILDLKFGSQPMKSIDGNYIIGFNGEIFNHKELRSKLKNKVSFQTKNSDTEVILNLYRVYGLDFLNLLNGMFAISIYDKKKDTLILARDRHGIKPLFYYIKNNKIFFSSEIKSLMQTEYFKKIPDVSSIGKFFFLKNIPCPNSAYKNVKSIAPGEVLIIDKQKFKRKTFWSFPKKIDKIFDKKIIKSEIKKKLQKSIMLQLDADVDVGSYLSGGIDSTAVSLMASKLSKKKLKTFSIVYDKNITNKKDDTFFSRKMAKYIGSDHHEFRLKESFLNDDVDKALLSFDQPFAGTITSYYLSKKISRHVKSVLTGDGADELFGSYIFPRKVEAYIKLNNINLQSEFIQKSPETLRFLDIICQKKMSIDELKIDGLSISKNSNQKLLNKKFLKKSLESIKNYIKMLSSTKNVSNYIDEAIKIDYLSLLPDQVLSYSDILSMRNSLEVRPPFLDNDLVDFAFRIPGEYKIKNSYPKIILKEALNDFVPQSVINREKVGFVAPMEEMFVKKNLSKVKSVLSRKNLKSHDFLNTENVIQLLKYTDTNNFYQNNFLWIIYCFQVWWNKNF